MRVNVITLMCTYNHHISMALALLDALQIHGITVDQGRGPSHIGLGDLFSEADDAEIEGHLAMLREAAGVDDPKPEPMPTPADLLALKEGAQAGRGREIFTLKPGECKTIRMLPDEVEKPKSKGKGKISAEGRARIAAAQRKRWAAKRKQAKA